MRSSAVQCERVFDPCANIMRNVAEFGKLPSCEKGAQCNKKGWKANVFAGQRLKSQSLSMPFCPAQSGLDTWQKTQMMTVRPSRKVSL